MALAGLGRREGVSVAYCDGHGKFSPMPGIKHIPNYTWEGDLGILNTLAPWTIEED